MINVFYQYTKLLKVILISSQYNYFIPLDFEEK